MDTEKQVKGNDKRIASCKKIGGKKKALGHEIEKLFTKQYNNKALNEPTEYRPQADTKMNEEHPTYKKVKKELKLRGTSASNKSGMSIQCTLGNIPEMKNIEVHELTTQKVREIFDKYLKKSTSLVPANILVYCDNVTNKWIFFNMDDVVNYIAEKCIWRKLESGRIKGDFKDETKKGFSQYITYEYRTGHKGYFLGFNGGKGKKFIELLMSATYGIKYYCDNIDS